MRSGSILAGLSRYMTWKTADGIKEASRFKPQLQTLFKGILQPAIDAILKQAELMADYFNS